MGSQPSTKSSVRTLAPLWRNTLWKAGQLRTAESNGTADGQGPSLWSLSLGPIQASLPPRSRGASQTGDFGNHKGTSLGGSRGRHNIHEDYRWRNSLARAGSIQLHCCSALPGASRHLTGWKDSGQQLVHPPPSSAGHLSILF